MERGRLRIFFGSSAGVGKTFAMLLAAREAQAQGRDVLVGIVETHGRSDTAALLQGLPVLPPAEVSHRDRVLQEFDLDGALARRPSLILVDELAHSNVPGSRHPKRWQDVEELLGSGIDVYTTLNVQHLESLNDVVGGITGIRVNETLPDTFFDAADEVVLVDVPADELLARLKAGKVYLPAQAERASTNFFRKGNLMALRELALRRTADRIETDVQAYRVDRSISPVWKTEAALLCCIGPQPGAEHVVRSAARLAGQLNVDWHAVYVETPALQRLGDARRDRILRTVELARDLGAATAVLPAAEISEALVDYARAHNLSRIVVGRAGGRRRLGASIGQRVIRRAPDVDLVVIGQAGDPALPAKRVGEEGAERDERDARSEWLRYLKAALTSLVPIAVAAPLVRWFDPANIVMLFLLAVVLTAGRWGGGPAGVSAFFAGPGFDFFFLPPQQSFAVADVQYLLTFIVMLVVGLVVGQLTSGLKYQARVAAHREARAAALYEFSRELSLALETDQVVEIGQRTIARQFRSQVVILVPDDAGRLKVPDGMPAAQMALDSGTAQTALDPGTAQWALDRREVAGLGTDTLPGSPFLYLPLNAPMRARGVAAIRPEQPRLLRIPEQRRQLETFGALVAIALERVHYVDVAQAATLRIESERLRNSLLSALSHDLRTPLAVLYGLTETLAMTPPVLEAAQARLLGAIQDECRRINALVDNLLDMARLQTGEIRLNRQWQAIEEVIGTALAAMRGPLGERTVTLRLPAELPLVEYDAVLIERVLVNLLENASKYTPPRAALALSAGVDGAELVVTLADDGPGLPPGSAAGLFEKFTRGERESVTPGVGLGLAISRAIVEAHQGRIWAEPNTPRGARFCFALPLGTPPAMPAPERAHEGADGWPVRPPPEHPHAGAGAPPPPGQPDRSDR
mgnify:FL=1